MFRRNNSGDVTEFNPIRCASTPCPFGRTRSGYAAPISFFSVALRRAVLQAATW